jgi:hypothetical protein
VTPSLVERYLRLGLQLGRHVEGIVDAYYGPPELADAVDAEPPVDPRSLVDAAEWLPGELTDGWLLDQVVGLRTCAGALAGSGSCADEVEGCFGVRRPTPMKPSSRPRTSDSPSCSQAWRPSSPRRAWTRGPVELPDREEFVLEVVRDNAYLERWGLVSAERKRRARGPPDPLLQRAESRGRT